MASCHVLPALRGQYMNRSNRVMSRAAGLLVLIYLLFLNPPFPLNPQVSEMAEIIGLLLLVIATCSRIFCVMYSAGSKNKRLLSSGPFSIVRNPLYVSSFIGIVGFGLVSGDLLLLACLIIFICIYYTITVAGEEQHLTATFGSDYDDYRSHTPRWFPRWGQYHSPDRLEIRPALVLKGTFYASCFVALYFILELFSGLREAGILPVIG